MAGESRQSIGAPSALRDCLFRGAISVFAFHGLPDWMRILSERIPFWTRTL